MSKKRPPAPNSCGTRQVPTQQKTDSAANTKGNNTLVNASYVPFWTGAYDEHESATRRRNRMCMLTTVFSATFLVFLSSSRRDSCACLLPVSLSRKQRLENCRCVSVWPQAAAVRGDDADECQSLERHCNWSTHTLWISRLRSFVLATDDSVIVRPAFPLNLS